jgi:uncharacterized membrane protein YjdF
LKKGSMSDPGPSSPRLLPVLAFTALYVAAISAVAIRTGNPALGMYLALLAIVAPALYAVNRRHPMPPSLLWCFSAWGLVHMAGGLVPIPFSWPREGNGAVLYNWWLLPSLLKFDQVVHAFGFGITSWLCWHLLKNMLRDPDGHAPRPTLGNLVLCAAAGMGFGALNEMVEFIATRLLPESNIGDYENAGWDLVANFIGALIAVTIIRLHARRS